MNEETNPQETLLATESPSTTPVTTEPVKVETPQVPEEYAAFTLPEGITLDENLVAEFKPLAKELGLTQEGAQKLVDLQTKMVQEFATKSEESWAKQTTEWLDASKDDKEFGGPKLQENLAIANDVLKKYGSDELMTYLRASGLGNHPELIRFVYKIGKAVAEDKTVVSGGNPNSQRTTEQMLFPTMFNN